MAKKNNIYHRDLVAAGPTRIQLTGPIRKSNKGVTHYVPILRDGDSEDSFFTIENDAVKAALEKVAQGVWVTVHARGTKGSESMTVEYPKGAEPREVQSVEDAMVEAMWAAHRVNARVPMPYPPELEFNMGITMFIQNPLGTRPWKSGDTESATAPVPEDHAAPEPEEFLDRRMPSGKHEGKTWRQIAELEPTYIDYVLRKWTSLSEDQKRMLQDLVEQVKDPFFQEGEVLFPEPSL